jgi:hypothetical protein
MNVARTRRRLLAQRRHMFRSRGLVGPNPHVATPISISRHDGPAALRLVARLARRKYTAGMRWAEQDLDDGSNCGGQTAYCGPCGGCGDCLMRQAAYYLEPYGRVARIAEAAGRRWRW